MENRCPCCGLSALVPFYEVRDVPVHSVLRIDSYERARRFPTGDVKLASCSNCHFITNAAFDPSPMNYSAEYEETQGFSPTFNVFHQALADDLIRRHDLRGKTVVEIGCGKGEFLTMICERGGNTGIGFDPAYVPGRNENAAEQAVTFIEDFYSEMYAGYRGDLVCCKMTLEHIQRPIDLISTVRRSIGDKEDTIVFFQVPEVRRVLRDLAFWDVYYEHCSYFSRSSLARLFASCGFEVLDVWTDYDDQYLMIEARPSPEDETPELDAEVESDAEGLAQDLAYFAKHVPHRLRSWKEALRAMKARGQRVALWGGGSKAVAFLTTLGIGDEVAYAVDINPHKRGTFLAKTAHEVVSPQRLAKDQPDVVIVMNPVYRDEIGVELAEMGLSPELLDVRADAVGPVAIK